MAEKYNFPYSEGSVYGHVVELLSHAPVEDRPGVHLDLGCGYGAMAEQLVAATGSIYVGVDADADGLAQLAARGFEMHKLTFGSVKKTLAELRQVLGDRLLRSLSCVDVLEHVNDPKALLEVLRSLVGDRPVPLVTSVPNVSHIDVAAKQLLGRFETTETGILDRTHITHFTNKSITKLLLATGWRPVDANDVEYLQSDQHFPHGHVALASGSLLARYLFKLRSEADKFHITNQLVRLSLPSVPQVDYVPEPKPRHFVSVLVPTSGSNIDDLWSLMLCLSAQTDADFEVLVLGIGLDGIEKTRALQIIDAQVPSLKARIRLIDCPTRTVSSALNLALDSVVADYVTVAEPGVLLRSCWTATFRALSEQSPGAVLRTAYQRQRRKKIAPPGSRDGLWVADGPAEMAGETSFDLMSHFAEDGTPSSAYVWPVSLAHDLNRRYDETLVESFAWDFLVRAAVVCGVASSEAATTIQPDRGRIESTEWQRVRNNYDSLLMLLPTGSAGCIAVLKERAGLSSDRDAWAAQRDIAVAERAATVAECDARAAERDAAIAQRDAAAAEHYAAVLQRDARTAERDAAKLERDAAIAQRDAAAAAHYAAVLERDARTAERNAAASERDAAIAERDAAILERDARLAERNAAVSERGAAIVERDRLLGEHDRAVRECDAAMHRLSAIRNSALGRLIPPWLRHILVRTD